MGIVNVAENLAEIGRRIARACERVKRPAGEVTLVGVSKKHPNALLREAYDAGLRDFGESYAQELLGRFEQEDDRQQEDALPEDIVWHFIGHLQRNKVSKILPVVDVLQSIDRERLIRQIARHAEAGDRPLPVLLQINTSGESSKYGCYPGGALTLAERILDEERLELRGVMTLAAYTDDPERTRPMFRLLRDTRDLICDRLGCDLPVLSMGMSNDFEVAIEEGSTMVRVGTAIFGERPAAG